MLQSCSSRSGSHCCWRTVGHSGQDLYSGWLFSPFFTESPFQVQDFHLVFQNGEVCTSTKVENPKVSPPPPPLQYETLPPLKCTPKVSSASGYIIITALYSATHQQRPETVGRKFLLWFVCKAPPELMSCKQQLQPEEDAPDHRKWGHVQGKEDSAADMIQLNI